MQHKISLSSVSAAMELAMRPPSDGRKIRAVTVFQVPLAREVKKCLRVRVAPRGGNSFVVTVGRPNYAERWFLRDCKAAKCQPKKFWIQYRSKKKK